jgi:putative ABC transport system permease protein
MFAHYVANAFGRFRRDPIATAIKVLALGLGLACFLLAHLVADHVRQTDRGWAAADRTYTLSQVATRPGGEVVSGSVGAISTSAVRYLREDFPELEIAATRTMTFPFKVGDRVVEQGNTLIVEPEFLDIFDLAMRSGRAAGALDAPRSALVTEDLALELFGRTDVVGETIELQNGLMNREDVTVTGVFAFDAPTHFGAESVGKNIRMIVDTDTLRAQYTFTRPDGSVQEATWVDAPDWAGTCCTTYLVLPEDGSLGLAGLEARLAEFSARRVPPDIGEMRFIPTPMSDVASAYMNTRLFGGAQVVDLPTVLTAFAALILIVACLDFANLATAEAAARAKEVGLRKAVGAGRGQIAVQTLIEAAVLTLGALLLVLPLVLLLAAPLGGLLQLEIALPGLDRPDYWLSVLAIAAVTGLAAGAYPALVLARVRPLFALRMGGARGGSPLVRTLLIGAQFAAASFLVVAIVVLHAQKAEIRDRLTDPSTDLRVTVLLPGDGSVNTETLRAELLAHPSVTGFAVSVTPPFRRTPYSSRGNDPLFARSEDPGAPRAPAQMRLISPGYFDAAGIAMVAGAEIATDAELPADGFHVVIDTRMAAELGLTPDQAVGQLGYYFQPGGSPGEPQQAIPGRIVGVAAATPLEYMTGGPSGYVYITQSGVLVGAAIVRVARGDVEAALAHIDETWAALAPDRPIRRMFLDEAFDLSFAMFNTMNVAFAAMSVLAAAIAAIGMFGVAGFVVEHRRHEVGVRKTLGATTLRVLRRLLWDFGKPVVAANLIAWPLAYLAAQAYLALFVNRIALTPVPFLIALAATLGIAWLAVGIHAWRAATLRPADVLRYE